MTKRELLDVLYSVHDDTVILIETPAGLHHVEEYRQQKIPRNDGGSGAALVLVPWRVDQ